jgi:hypothetical protein
MKKAGISSATVFPVASANNPAIAVVPDLPLPRKIIGRLLRGIRRLQMYRLSSRRAFSLTSHPGG